MPRPRIGICDAPERARWAAWDREVSLTPRSYIQRVQEAGARAVLLPVDAHAVEDPAETLDGLDGLILAGGADIDPANYGMPADPHTVDMRPERDAFELALARCAVERDLPLLGICRGMQLINVALGGTLIQHLPDAFGHGDHRRRLGSFEDADHDVRIEEGTLAHRVIGEVIHGTKSHHHQGVDRLGDGLVATGWATIDGLVEVIELPGARFCLGVQWHPEADGTSPVIGALVKAAAGIAA